MAGALLLMLITNAIFFSCIFWLLTFLGKLFYSNKYYNYKLNFYECGFKNLTGKTIQYDINYILLMIFLLVYDGEFLILIPYALNSDILDISVCLSIVFFFLWILVAMYYDFSYKALDWQLICFVWQKK